MGWLILLYTLQIYKWLVIARVLMSWFVSPHASNPVIDLVRRLTDPILRPISEMLPPLGGFDISPIVAFFGITLLQQVIVRIA
jgi:YggT family protein